MDAPPQAYEARVDEFWHAVRKGRVGEVEMMITRLGMDVNLRCKHRREKGGTILHVAARHGHLDLMRWVLQLRQVEVDAIDNRGKTALYRACVGKHTACALLLAEAGADTSFSTTRGGDALREAQAMRKSYGFDLKEVSLKRHISAPAGMRNRVNSTSGRAPDVGTPKEEKGALSMFSARLRALFPGGNKEKERESPSRPLSPSRSVPSPASSLPHSPRTADGRPKDAPALTRGRSISGAHVSSDPRLVRPADAIQQSSGGPIKVSASPRAFSSQSSTNLRQLRSSPSQPTTSLSSSPTNSTSALRLYPSSSAVTSSTAITSSRSASPPAPGVSPFPSAPPRSQSPSMVPREPAGPRPRAPFIRSTSSPAVSDMRPPAEPRTDTFLLPSSDAPEDARMVQQLRPASVPAFNFDEVSRLLLRLCRALVATPFDLRSVSDCMQQIGAAVYHMSSLLPALTGCVSVTRRNQITAKARDITAAVARLERLLAEAPAEPSPLLFEVRVLLADLWSMYTTAEHTAPDALRDVASSARSLTAAVLDASKDETVSPLVSGTITSSLTYLSVSSMRALGQTPSEHLAFMQASLAVARIVKNVCASAQAVLATRSVLGDDAPASSVMTDLARRLAEAVKAAVPLSSKSSQEELPTPVRFDEALAATAITGFEDILLRPALKSPRGEGVRRSLGPLQTALLASSQPLVDAASSLLSLFPVAPPPALCDAVGAFGEELSAHALLLLRSAMQAPADESRLYIAASQAVLQLSLQLKMAAAARALAYPVMPVSVTVVCCVRALSAALGLASDNILHS